MPRTSIRHKSPAVQMEINHRWMTQTCCNLNAYFLGLYKEAVKLLSSVSTKLSYTCVYDERSTHRTTGDTTAKK
jgi:hypothetical protein